MFKDSIWGGDSTLDSTMSLLKPSYVLTTHWQQQVKPECTFVLLHAFLQAGQEPLSLGSTVVVLCVRVRVLDRRFLGNKGNRWVKTNAHCVFHLCVLCKTLTSCDMVWEMVSFSLMWCSLKYLEMCWDMVLFPTAGGPRTQILIGWQERKNSSSINSNHLHKYRSAIVPIKHNNVQCIPAVSWYACTPPRHVQCSSPDQKHKASWWRTILWRGRPPFEGWPSWSQFHWPATTGKGEQTCEASLGSPAR